MAMIPPLPPLPGSPNGVSESVLRTGQGWEGLDREEGQVIEQLRAGSLEALPDPDRWIDEEVERGVLVTSLDYFLGWARYRSVWPLMFGLACCAFEMISVAASRFDIARFGMEFVRFSPRQADLMLVAGTLTWKMAPALKRIYDQMSEPKWVVAMGQCAISGGPFAEYVSVVPGLNHIVPVDVYVPGCPPRPESLLHGLGLLHEKIQKEGSRLKRGY